MKRFRLQLSDDIVRGMNRQQYKTASHYARWLARYIDGKINWDAVSKIFADTAIYGRAEYYYEDLIKS